MRCCQNENLYLVMGCDSIAHHIARGSTKFNDRVKVLVEVLDFSNLEILNQGNEPTFCLGFRQEVIGITLGPFGILQSITSWEVSSEPRLSDHRHIRFTLRDSVPVRLIRNPRGNNWGSFRESLKDRLKRSPEMNMKDEARLGIAVH